jgi:hypothetical protein
MRNNKFCIVRLLFSIFESGKAVGWLTWESYQSCQNSPGWIQWNAKSNNAMKLVFLEATCYYNCIMFINVIGLELFCFLWLLLCIFLPYWNLKTLCWLNHLLVFLFKTNFDENLEVFNIFFNTRLWAYLGEWSFLLGRKPQL